MKNELLPALRLTFICIVVFVGLYTLFILGIATVIVPSGGKANTLQAKGKTVGAELVGQAFTRAEYFQGRPSAVDYNGAGSCGSNKGPSNPDYLATVQGSIDTILKYNPEIKKSQIPAELVTASGSGLDPDISPEAAYIQIPRIAKIRKMSTKALYELVKKQTTTPLLGLFGPSKVNVLKLNIALQVMDDK